ncbi:Alpha-monoglucosyldiacylglycerol synthase [Saliniradius amylolyticus]|uniref:Alpha-monoglucosyldiacylglycerol synthase n=1 Tax=Saliniradius amylolyticus TaxID=2183582 RepID=A0A2S2E0U4_9ALTE|nr:Alpha-monoglucosyldiacylglycerol synthase [Saliniradius amylolyticus]
MIADQIVVVSKWWQNRIEKVYPELKDKIVVNQNGLSPVFLAKAMKEAHTPDSPSETVRVITMTRLLKKKGVQRVIEAMRFLPPEFHLSIAGTGPYVGELQKLSIKLQLESRIRFLGWLNEDEKIQQMKSHDVFAMPSEYDSFGMVFIEAMACGLPVVTTPSGPITDIVTNGIDGIIARSTDGEDIARAIEKAYQNCVSMADNARNNVSDNFRVESGARELVSLFSRMSGKSVDGQKN